jgi:hypothetical protein
LGLEASMRGDSAAGPTIIATLLVLLIAVSVIMFSAKKLRTRNANSSKEENFK